VLHCWDSDHESYVFAGPYKEQFGVGFNGFCAIRSDSVALRHVLMDLVACPDWTTRWIAKCFDSPSQFFRFPTSTVELYRFDSFRT
jgi:hypothetical protein